VCRMKTPRVAVQEIPQFVHKKICKILFSQSNIVLPMICTCLLLAPICDFYKNILEKSPQALTLKRVSQVIFTVLQVFCSTAMITFACNCSVCGLPSRQRAALTTTPHSSQARTRCPACGPVTFALSGHSAPPAKALLPLTAA